MPAVERGRRGRRRSPPCTWASMPSGLTGAPQSIAQTTRCTRMLAVGRHRDLRDLGDDALERLVHREAAGVSLRQRRCPSRPSPRRARARAAWRGVLGEQRAAVPEGILPGGVGELVDHRLHRERGVRVAHRAPPEDGDRPPRRVELTRRAGIAARYGESTTPSTEVSSMPFFTMRLERRAGQRATGRRACAPRPPGAPVASRPASMRWRNGGR